MAVYIEDWSGQTTGTGVPAGWTPRWHGGTVGVFEIIEDTDAPGGKKLRISRTSASSSRAGLSMVTEEGQEAKADCDILALVRPVVTGGTSNPSANGGIYGRGQGVTNAVTNSALLFAPNSLGDQWFQRVNYSSGTVTSDSFGEGSWELGELYWLRLTIKGSSTTARVYPHEDPKGTPIVSHTSMDAVSGESSLNHFGFFFFRQETVLDVMWFGVGTGTDDAPLPVGWGIEVPQGTSVVTNVEPGLNSAVVTYSYNAFDADSFEYRLGSGTPVTLGSSPATIYGLIPDTDYSIQVRPKNLVGVGQWSTAFTFRTQEGAYQVPQGEVTVSEAEVTASTATIPYSYDGEDAEGFEYRVAPSTTWIPTGESPIEVVGLSPSTMYTLQVRAVNSVGGGAPTSLSFTTEKPSNSIEVVWDIDSGCVDPTSINVINAESAEPIIELSPRRTGGGTNPSAPRWIHFNFMLRNAEGKRPVFRVNVANRWTGGAQYVTEWRPVFTADHKTWEQAPSRSIVSNIAEWQFSEAFTDHEVYVSDQQVFRTQDFSDMAATLASDLSGLVRPSAAADQNGVISVTPQETDDLGRNVGGNPIYGFVLGNDEPTDDGGPKRWLIADAGIHPGEILDGFGLRGMIEFYLYGTNLYAEKLRRNWKLGVYFSITPNGRYGGNWRSNFRNTKDPNRDWGGTGAFSLEESISVRDAILADLDGHIEEVGLSFHCAASFTATEQVWRTTALSDTTIQDAWLDALDMVDGVAWTRTDTNIATSVTGWHVSRGAKIGVIFEIGTRTSNTVDRYEQCGQRFLEATAEVDAQGLFYEPTVTESPGITLPLFSGQTPVGNIADVQAFWWNSSPPAGSPTVTAVSSVTDGVLSLELPGVPLGTSGHLMLWKQDEDEVQQSLGWQGQVTVEDLMHE